MLVPPVAGRMLRLLLNLMFADKADGGCRCILSSWSLVPIPPSVAFRDRLKELLHSRLLFRDSC